MVEKNTNVEDLPQFWKAETLAQSGWLIEQSKIKMDESVREGKSKLYREMF